MRKPKKRVNRTLVLLRQAQFETRRAQSDYRHSVTERERLEQRLEMQTARITWLETQQRRDQVLIDHLVEAAKWSAKKGVQGNLR